MQKIIVTFLSVFVTILIVVSVISYLFSLLTHVPFMLGDNLLIAAMFSLSWTFFSSRYNRKK